VGHEQEQETREDCGAWFFDFFWEGFRTLPYKHNSE